MVAMADDHKAGPRTGTLVSRPWVRRAEGDRRRRLRATLELVGGQGVVVLNDRRVPDSTDTIPLIAVGPAGVFVIDAQHHRGLVHTKRPGAIGQLDLPELHVGRRNCTPSLDELGRRVEIVRTTLDGAAVGSDVPVTAMLCLTRAEWGIGSWARVRDVWVGWPTLMAGALVAPPCMDSPTVQEVAGAIGDRLPAI
jgi:hypothetical protein